MAVARRTDDFELAGRLFTPLYASAGLSMGATAIVEGGPGRVVMILGAVLAGLAAAVGTQVPWGRLPAGLARSVPFLAVALLITLAVGASGHPVATLVCTALLTCWTGFSLELTDLVITVALSGLIDGLATRHLGGPSAGLVVAVSVFLPTTGLGGCMYWLRGRLDQVRLDMVQAEAQRAAAVLAEQTGREQLEAARAQEATAELARRSSLQQKVAEQAAALLTSASGVSGQTGSVAGAVDEMSRALDEITRTAQVSDQISAAVTAKAVEAQEVMALLSQSSARIMAASDVIQGIAEQTNLLALNATIESARAGEAGRGFAVVASEVKELARQSGDNADTITRTLTEVRSQVETAVARVAEIVVSMGELNQHNGSLAAAVEEQSAVVRQIVDSVNETSAEATVMSQRASALEEISRGA